MKKKKLSDLFGKKIKYTEILSRILYIQSSERDFEKDKLYKENILIDHDSMNPSFRKILFEKVKGEGIIVGYCTRWEGIYFPKNVYESEDEDFPENFLERKNHFNFFKVATKMNTIILVERNSLMEVI